MTDVFGFSLDISRCPLDVSRCSLDVLRVFTGFFQNVFRMVRLVLWAWWNLMIISNESMAFNDPKELDDPQIFDDPSYSMSPSYLMIPSHLMMNWKYESVDLVASPFPYWGLLWSEKVWRVGLPIRVCFRKRDPLIWENKANSGLANLAAYVCFAELAQTQSHIHRFLLNWMWSNQTQGRCK